MLNEQIQRVEELRQLARTRVRAGEYEAALDLYDEALTLTNDDELRELITINKADALVALERTGPEVAELPRVIMRRRNLRHVYLAAYALQYKHRLENDLKRALFYGQLALRTAEEAGEASWRRIVLLELGNIYELDSQIPTAIECFQESLAISEESPLNEKDLSHGYAVENLGYCLLLQGRIEDGLAYVHEAAEMLSDPIGRAEAYIDLCYGYLEQGDFEKALHYGEAGLAIAKDQRQVRNAHYLLGEACYKSGDPDGADHHFTQLAKFYPQFRNLKHLLFAIDLRSMVNLKL
ncbi:MAG: tetratricopeptide repeat protein [Acidobacteria bacterium]|nr:tetratricopeptide repeat protein [Acidobacteriota bacterium]MBV9476418.1 tetratricopeptide repeat protein [Acidobacteriota bacterium]